VRPRPLCPTPQPRFAPPDRLPARPLLAAGKTSLLQVLAGKYMVGQDVVCILGRPAFHDIQLVSTGTAQAQQHSRTPLQHRHSSAACLGVLHLPWLSPASIKEARHLLELLAWHGVTFAARSATFPCTPSTPPLPARLGQATNT
jgi:hypothetical protein